MCTSMLEAAARDLRIAACALEDIAAEGPASFFEEIAEAERDIERALRVIASVKRQMANRAR